MVGFVFLLYVVWLQLILVQFTKYKLFSARLHREVRDKKKQQEEEDDGGF